LRIDIVEKEDRLEVRGSNFSIFFYQWFVEFLLEFDIGMPFPFCVYQLVEHDSEGQCNSECKTIERACQDV
jgi:hypothetical protein